MSLLNTEGEAERGLVVCTVAISSKSQNLSAFCIRLSDVVKLAKELKKEKAVTEQTANRAVGQAQEGAQQWLGMLQGLAEQIQKQQQNSQQMVQELMNTYMQLLNTPGSYVSGQAQQQQQTFQQQAEQQQQAFQQMVQETTNTFMQMFNIPLSYAQEGLQTAQRSTAEVPVEGYDEMNVGEVAEQLDNLSADELERVRDYERRNKNRETLLGQIDHKINAAS